MRNPLDIIENIQDKPESSRKVIAAVSVGVIMFFILAVWIATFSLAPTGSAPAASAEAAASQPSPFVLLWNFTKDSFSSLKDSFK